MSKYQTGWSRELGTTIQSIKSDAFINGFLLAFMISGITLIFILSV